MYREQWNPVESVFNFSFREREFSKITSAYFFKRLKNTVQMTREKYELPVNYKLFNLFSNHIKTRENIYDRKKAWKHFLKSKRPDITHLGKNGVFVEILKPEYVFKP